MEGVRYMGETGYLISEAAKQAGVESHVLRYWEEELKLPIARNEMGHRYYTKQDIQIFLTIKELKKRGFQLKMIRELVPRIEDVQMEQAETDSDGKMGAKGAIISSQSSGNEVREVAVDDKFSKNEVKGVAVRGEPLKSEVAKGGTLNGQIEKKSTVKNEAAKNDAVKNEGVRNEGVRKVAASKETAKETLKNEGKNAEEKAKHRVGPEVIKNVNKLKVKPVQSVPVRDIKKEQAAKTKKDNQQEAFYQIMERLFVQLTGEKRSEDRYKRLDAAIRKQQYSRRMVAATEEQGKKRKKK